jgi:hypothetical protein
MEFFAKLRSLKPAGRRVLLWVTFALPLTALGLRVFGFRRVYAALERLSRRARLSSEDETRQVRRARHVIRYAAKHGPYRGNCLSRSLVLWWLLRRRGIESDLRIGVRRDAENLDAHAWVEYQGRPLNAHERVHEQYAAFDGAILPRGARFV